ncbi:putative lipoprotein [Corallococcus coralloides DSM 2259]|uniref:Putative lipoprotein n=1 Tax=Corallococcus coralloides (strain ATCC 25202 / DSM 2259 / NBRC 100086 / M2) TaxID=1144275 RepID=H8MP66_CORCM|nr:hypothetical protein [Corallococcus coralloides]AFE03870.1 putative lipoprotein [Corallococcus coralloides DSM 2259]
MNWHVAKRMGVVLAVALLAACGDDGDKPDGGTKTDGGTSTTKSAGPGLGNSKAAPEGTTFALPAGLTMDNPITSYTAHDPIECDNIFPEDAKGSGDEVTLCLIFRNTTGAPITLTLPPGLLFVSTNDDVQNGLLVQTVTIEVPPGERFFVPLFLYCANQDRSTTGPDDKYVLGPTVQYKEFQELYSLLASKKLGFEDTGVIQVAVDHLANGEGLSSSDRAALQAL